MNNSNHEKMPPGMYPFWFWNGDMLDGEIARQISEMADKGIKGFYIHARQGLKKPYLSEAFFHAVRTAITEAERHGMTVHIYDEYPYPSGVAGGSVTLGEPAFYATQLSQTTYDVPGGGVRLNLPRGKLLSLIAYPLDADTGVVDFNSPTDLMDFTGMVLDADSYIERGLTQYNKKRYLADRPTPVLDTALPDIPHRIYAAVQLAPNDFKYFDHYADVMNPDAIARFIERTHETYKLKIGDAFSRSVLSVFCDEIEPRWTARLPEKFKERYDYDLLPMLPALADESHPEHLRVTRDVNTLKYDLFLESFEKPVRDWCHANGLWYSGEKPSMRLSMLKYMDIPGCEPGHTKAGSERIDSLKADVRANARATASASYFYDKVGSLDECYHSLGWSATLQDAKLIAEELLLMGIDYLVPHGFFYSTHALRKHDAPPSFFFQMPYWPHFGTLSKRIDAIYSQFAGTHIDANVLIVDPHPGLPTRIQLTAFERMMRLLLERHIEFMLVDVDILESGRIEDGAFHCRDIAAPVIIVPPMRIPETALTRWLADFEMKGGTVIQSETMDDAELISTIESRVAPSISITVDGEHAGAIHAVSRAGEDGRRWFLINHSSQPVTARIRCDTSLEEVPLDDTPPELSEDTDLFKTGYVRRFSPFESVLLAEKSAGANGDESRTGFGNRERLRNYPVVDVPVNGTCEFRLLTPNLARLGEWEMALLNDDGTPYHHAAVKPMPIINQLDDGNFRFAPKMITHFGLQPELTMPEMTVRYRASFLNTYRGAIRLIMEPDSLVGRWKITINSSPCLTDDSFEPSDVPVSGTRSCDVTDHIRIGKNSITVEMRVFRKDGGMLSPLYLAGDFGVTVNPLKLLTLKTRGRFDDYEKNALSHFSGVVEYHTTFTLAGRPDASPVIAAFVFDKPFHDACEVSINDGPWRELLWEPRRLVVDGSEFRKGRNRLRIRVKTSLIRAFEGQYFDIPNHRYNNVGASEHSEKGKAVEYPGNDIGTF